MPKRSGSGAGEDGLDLELIQAGIEEHDSLCK